MLPDVNVWLALAFEAHAHHPRAKGWFDTVDVGAALCRMTQQGFLRLASNPSVFGEYTLTLQQAWSCYEAPGLELQWRAYTSTPSYSPEAWNDACLVAFAAAAGLTLVTFDGAITSYPQSRALVLEASA